MLVATLVISPMSAPIAAKARSNPAAIAGEPGLVGTWRLVRYENTAKDGTVTKRYGERPSGYFVYDATGHLSIHIMRNPPLPPFASGDSTTATTEEKAHAFSAYVGYFGTYKVDKARQLLTHVVEGALDTTYTNTNQLRPYKLKGDTLIIAAKNQDSSSYYRELHRVR
jgi:hypothetical protein